MGTISDKLMRIINTKEDIRQALISKGYDVPTSIPFKEYAKMILDLPCNAGSFLDIEGIVARYSASGLTNEQMAANPVWVDKTGNGHDMQLKNFSWKGMSGVGGYGDENHQTFYKFTLYDYAFIATPPGVKHMNFTFRVTGLQPGNKLTLAFFGTFFGTTNTVYGTWDKDGIYTVNSAVVEVGKPVYFYNGYGATRGEFTIEILPLYPGALVFDGVDDWAGCDNLPLLPKEKGYSIIALRTWITRYDATKYKRPLISNLDKDDGGAFLIEYRKDENVNDVTGSYNSFTDVYIDDNNPITWQTSSSYNGQIIKKGTSKSTNKLCICKTYFNHLSNYANAAIWEIIILDHDATGEELTKIKDYFVKTYPWLFPDQAWTVTGKTNEDEDRATIANITGNGNNLVLSNFGFSENSGYGSYPFGMNVWNPDYIADQPYGTVHYPNDSKSYATTVKNNATNFRIKFRLRGLPEGGSFLIRVFDMNDLNTVLKTYTYTENGIHEFVYNDPNKPARIILYNGNTISNISEFYLDIIPEYEGYLVTDGVDDKIVSSVFGMGKDFTIVGDWKFIDNKKNGIKSINAACSDGRAYDRNWNEILANTDNVVGYGGMLEVSSRGGRFDRIAFKNLAIYPRILSKDDCIKAYNYLQTLKAK